MERDKEKRERIMERNKEREMERDKEIKKR